MKNNQTNFEEKTATEVIQKHMIEERERYFMEKIKKMTIFELFNTYEYFLRQGAHYYSYLEAKYASEVMNKALAIKQEILDRFVSLSDLRKK